MLNFNISDTFFDFNVNIQLNVSTLHVRKEKTLLETIKS